MDKIRIGVIGLGEIAQVMHLPLLAQLPQFELAGAADISHELLELAQQRYGVQHCSTDFEDLFPYVDAVAVLTMDHADIVEAAAEAGKNVFVEKPLSFSPERCERTIETCRRNGTLLMIGYMRRFDLSYLYVVDSVHKTRDVSFARVHDFGGSFSIHPPIYDIQYPTDISAEARASNQEKIVDEMRAALGPSHAHLHEIYFEVLMSGIHDLTMLRGLFGQADGVATSQRIGNAGVLSVLEYPNEVKAVLELDLHTDARWWDQRIDVFGADRAISLVFPNPFIRNVPATVVVRENDELVPVERASPVSYETPFRREWEHFAECVTNNRPPLTNGEDATADVRLAVEVVRAISSKAQPT